ncbi:UNVERIFIED_CONTAM: hypothetical protein FKN15_069115 [Acipenser sinensis]
MNTRCPPKRVPSAARFFTLCRLTVQPPQSYSVRGQRSSGQLTGKPAVSENDDSFEVTMTATTEMTENEIGEGAVAQIQIIQNDGSLSPNTTDDVSPVSQAWFTTKEDKDSLVNKGHKWKQGMWSKEEIDILMSNIDCYLKSFHLQPTGTPGTYFIQTGSNQGLPLTLSTSPTVTLTTAASPSSPDQIIVHALSPDNLLNSSDNVTVQMSHPSVIIRAVASDDIGSPGTQTDLTVDHPDLTDPQQTLEVDSFSSDIHQDKLDEDQDSPPTDLGNGSELRHANQRKFLYSTTAEPETGLEQEEEVQTELTGTYTDQAFGSPTMEEQVGESTIAEGTVLIVSSTDGFMQTTDLDNDSVLPLTTLTDPILEHQGEVLDINSSLDSPNPEDSKDSEGFVDCR